MNTLPVLADDSGFTPPGIEEFFPPLMWSGTPGGWFDFDRIMLIRFAVAAALILLLWLGTRKATLVPSRGQAAVEFGLDFVRVQIVEQILGKIRGRPYVPMLTTIFFLILSMNLAGIVPGLNLAGTARIGLPLLLAVIVMLVYIVAGMKKQGVGGYLKSQLFPPGIPWPAYILVTPIEFLQVFFLRPGTLALRLLANMMAGHLMLVLTFLGTNFLLLYAGGLVKVTGVLVFFAAIFITLFEVFIAALQAYIFTLLSAIYLNFALEEAA